MLPLSLLAQEIPKNSDKIIVTNTQTAEQNFIKAKQVLADQDIAVAVQDRDIFQISTGRIRQSDNASFQYLINCREGKVSITGTWSSNIGLNLGGITQGASTYTIKYKGLQKLLFNQMNDFAKKLGENIEYQSSVVVNEPKKKSNDDLY